MAAPVNSILQVTLRTTVNAQTCLNVLHYRVAVEAAAANIQTEQQNFLVSIGTGGTFSIVDPYVDALPSNATLEEVRAQFISPTRYRYSSITPATPGQRAGDCEAQNVSAVITKYTPQAGRSQIGSFHMPGLMNADLDNGLVAINYRANFLGPVKTAITAQVAEDSGTGLYNPTLYHKTLPGGQNSTDISLWVIQDTLRVMRRRTLRIGI